MTKRIYSPIAEEEKYTAFSGPKLDLLRKLLLYGRQSTKGQVLNNKEAYEQQTVRLLEMGLELGWKEEAIIVYIENKREDGRWRNASGRLRIDQRPGLQALIERIVEGEGKAVLVWAVDRLFRDETMIQPAVFVEICKENGCIVLTVDDYFDFNNPKRDDRRRFLELAQAAADYVTKHVKGRMHPARAQVSKRGEFDGRKVATGFILLKDEKTYRVHEPHAEVMSYLFKRFRELDAQFNLLWREVAGKELFPPYPKGMDIMGVSKERFEKSFGVTYQGLKDMLQNPVYIGWWYFHQKGKAPIIRKNNHPAIIDEKDFWYAFNHLSKTTISGDAIEENISKIPTRFDRVGTIPALALLDGIVTNLEFPVYVFQKADNPKMAAYTITSDNSNSAHHYRASIRVDKLDSIFVERLKYRLRFSQALDAVRDKMKAKAAREQSMYEKLKAIQTVISVSNVSIDKQISQAKSRIAKLELVLGIVDNVNESDKKLEEELDEDTIIKSLKLLKKLRVTLAELENKKRQSEASDEDLREAASLIVDASVEYDEFKFDRKRNFVRLITTRIVLTEPSPNWLCLTIEWSPYLGLSVIDTAYIWRHVGASEEWTDDENSILRKVYEASDRDTILRTLPKRSYLAIKTQASRLDLRKQYSFNNSLLPASLSYEDHDFLTKNELEFSGNKSARSVWWKTEAIEKNETSQSPRSSDLRQS
jgi:DNA invertase Pin-like site-specific DNA recombinase